MFIQHYLLKLSIYSLLKDHVEVKFRRTFVRFLPKTRVVGGTQLFNDPIWRNSKPLQLPSNVVPLTSSFL